jgi:DNA replication protein DnaC
MARRPKSSTASTPGDEQRKRVLALFAALRLPLRPEQLDETLRAADREGLAPLDFVERLLAPLVAERRDRSIEYRIRKARFPQRRTLEDFDWSFNEKAIDRRQIEALATCDFIRRQENLILVGQSGVGKSHIVLALGLRACALGYRVLFTTSAEMIRALTASLADATLPTKLRLFTAPDLLIIDEFAFDHIERANCRDAAALLYKVIDERNGKRSTAVVTNLDFAAWAEYLGDAPLTMAFTDRLVDRATILRIRGKSYRAHRRRPPDPT